MGLHVPMSKDLKFDRTHDKGSTGHVLNPTISQPHHINQASQPRVPLGSLYVLFLLSTCLFCNI